MNVSSVVLFPRPLAPRPLARRPLARRSLAGRSLAGAAALLVLTACGGGGNAFDGSSSSAGTSAKTIVIGGGAFTEARIMQQMYAALLQDAGLTTEVKNADRPIYTKALQSGEIDVVPDYVGSTLNTLYNNANPSNKAPVSTSDVQASLAKLREVGKPVGLGALEPAQASDQNAFYVTKKFAVANGGVGTLSDLSALGKKLTLGAPGDCAAPSQPFCITGLTKTYGLRLTLADQYEFGSVKLREDVSKGVVDVGESGTTDGTLEANGMVVLVDDKKLQPAENLVPVVNLKDTTDPRIAAALNKLAPVLTTEDLRALNTKVDAERSKPEDVAREYLKAKGLIR
jgi:osmoprotectant transport system substrate-binding protein